LHRENAIEGRRRRVSSPELQRDDDNQPALALLRQFFAARSVIEVALRPHKLTGQGATLLESGLGKGLAVLST
jgi:hypothetical protein